MSEMQVQYIAHSGSDLLVVNAARVSFAKESKQFNDKDQKLITYLAEHKHWLPFRLPHVTLRCKAPMFVARQVGKHQTGLVGQRNHVATLIHRLSSTGLTSGVSVRKIRSKAARMKNPSG